MELCECYNQHPTTDLHAQPLSAKLLTLFVAVAMIRCHRFQGCLEVPDLFPGVHPQITGSGRTLLLQAVCWEGQLSFLSSVLGFHGHG